MKKMVLVGLVLLASVMVLVGCKHEVEAQHEVESQHEHTFDNWRIKETPTEAIAGSKERVCNVIHSKKK